MARGEGGGGDGGRGEQQPLCPICRPGQSVCAGKRASDGGEEEEEEKGGGGVKVRIRSAIGLPTLRAALRLLGQANHSFNSCLVRCRAKFAMPGSV